MISSTNTNDLITVVVPVYNAAEYLRRCLKSILNQSYEQFELILINDGSKDESGIICEEFAALDPRVKVMHQCNRGVSAARNKGISDAKGKYIAFCDSDDTLKPDYLKRLYNMAQLNNDCLPICLIEVYGKEKQEYHTITDIHIPIADFPLLFENNLLNSPCNKLYRMDLIKRLDIKFDSFYSYGEDALFNLDYIENIKGFSIIDIPLYCYHLKDGEGLHSLGRAEKLDYVKILYRKLKLRVGQFDSSDKMRFYIRKNSLEECVFIIWQYAINSKDVFWDKYKNLKQLLKSSEYLEIAEEMGDIPILPKRRKVMQVGSAMLILLYSKLIILKTHLIRIRSKYKKLFEWRK